MQSLWCRARGAEREMEAEERCGECEEGALSSQPPSARGAPGSVRRHNCGPGGLTKRFREQPSRGAIATAGALLLRCCGRREVRRRLRQRDYEARIAAWRCRSVAMGPEGGRREDGREVAVRMTCVMIGACVSLVVLCYRGSIAPPSGTGLNGLFGFSDHSRPSRWLCREHCEETHTVYPRRGV